MFGYSTILRTQTQGKGEYTMEFVRYAPVDSPTQESVIYDWKVANGLIDPRKEKKRSGRK
jgi:elongation factor G